ncbi:MAG TPA: integrin alpha [Solirubrobacteraceae bacterium]
MSGTLDLVDVPPSLSVRYSAEEEDGLAGGAVAGIGDFDGDGRRDVAVGEPKRDSGDRDDAGAVYVVFDPAKTTDLSKPGDVVTIRGAQGGDFAGFDVAAAGDVNGDGRADLLVGAPLAGPRPQGASVGGGEAYVVFGRPGRAEIDLAAPDFGGIRIVGAESYSWFGRAVSTVPDSNGDGRGELVIGAPLRDAPDRPDAGSAYVIFGPADAQTIDVARLPDDQSGFRIDGPAPNAFAGRAVSSMGDIDQDGLPEVLVTAPQAPTGPSGSNGAAYVVRSQATPGVIDLAQLEGRGFVLSRTTTLPGDGERNPGDWLGESISGLGDVNGDGVPDFVVGAHLANAPNRARAGVAYIIFGKADKTPIDAHNLGAAGFRVQGVDRQDQTGFSTSPAGDFNADGVQDLAIGAPFADPIARESAGAVYVVYGGSGDVPNVDLAELGERGVRIIGRDGDATGFTLDTAGDVDGDGGPDLVIGSPATDDDYLESFTSERAGSASLVFGVGRGQGNPLDDLKSDPGYGESIAAGCTPALNVQAVLEDNAYTDEDADPERIRKTGMQAFVATPRNFGTVLGITAFDRTEESESSTIFPPTELGVSRVRTLQRALQREVDGGDIFPGYGPMFRALAEHNPNAGARIMLVDGFLFKRLRGLRGLTRGSAPTYVIAVGEPPDRNAIDISEMKRVARETKGRYFEARTPKEINRALQAIESRLRCDVEADNYQEELQAGDDEEVAEVEVLEGVHSADITLTWIDEDEDFEIEEVVISGEDGEVVDVLDDEEIDDAYTERDPEARLSGGRGRTFRTLHLTGLTPGRTLRVVARSDDRRSSGRVFARVTQSRNRR